MAGMAVIVRQGNRNEKKTFIAFFMIDVDHNRLVGMSGRQHRNYPFN